MKKDNHKKSPLEKKIDDLENMVVKLQKELEESKKAQMRALADLQNYQRRESENKQNWVSFGIAEFLKHFLPRFLELKLGAEHSSDKGLQKVVETFFGALKKQGLESIVPKEGHDINPEIHEVMMVEKGKAGKIVRILEPGWKYREIILSPAKVSAAQQ